MTIDINLDEIEAIAKEATAGLWEVNEGDDEITLDKNTALTRWNESGTVGYPARSWKTIDRLVEFDPEDLEEDEVEELLNDLQHIAAARPEVMLALIERLRSAEAALCMVTDDEVEAAARSLASLEPGEDWPKNDSLGGSPTGSRYDEYRDNLRDIAREALEAAARTHEKESA